ncbi:MAG: ATP-binding protein [Myxococcota bacterium]|nr:ATP-binding protein [Myxococcota bacterium]
MRRGLRGGLILASIVLTAALVGVAAAPDVDAADARLRRILLPAAALGLAVAVVMSTLAAIRFSRRARQIVEAASRMADGDLDARSRVAGAGALADVGRALDRLADGLSRTLGKLRADRDLLDGVLHGMHEGVLLLDPNGRVALVNPALRGMLLGAAPVEGKLLLEVVRHAELKELLDRARASGAAAGEIEVRDPPLRRLLVRAAPLDGRPGSLLAVFVDVTDLRRREAVRSEFVANVSHELRTPIAALRSAAETLRTSARHDPAAAERFIDIIDRGAERIHRLVEDLLDLSRIESGEMRLDAAPVDVGRAAREATAQFAESAGRKGIALAVAVPDGLGPARADARALERILSNLLDNAIKYCPPGASVTVRAAEEADDLRLEVEDTGPGIEPRHVLRIFERFYRVDPGRSRAEGGTGLGLSIVRRLAEAMGGAVSVRSIAGAGSVFIVHVPRA